MLRQAEGHRVYDPVSFAFNVLEEGGTTIQKYDAITASYVPDRTLTPLTLVPQLYVKDLSGTIANGDKSSEMVNVTWTLAISGKTLAAGTDYSINGTDNSLTVYKNVAAGDRLTVSFRGQYYEQTRGEVATFLWSGDLTTNPTTEYVMHLVVDVPSKLKLSPFKNRGKFAISAQLYNGDVSVPDSKASYRWYFLESDGSTWTELSDTNIWPLWYVSGTKTKSITVDQNLIGKAVLKCVANETVKGYSDSFTFQLRRWYGQYDDNVVFTEGKYIYSDTVRATGQTVITNRQGTVSNPLDFFDIIMYYSRDKTQWFQVAIGDVATVPRSMFGADTTTSHLFGALTREKSQYVPITAGGKILTIGGLPLIAQFPTSENDVV